MLALLLTRCLRVEEPSFLVYLEKMASLVPELLAKKRKRDETWAAAKATEAAEARKKARVTRREIFKRAEKYVKEYRSQVSTGNLAPLGARRHFSSLAEPVPWQQHSQHKQPGASAPAKPNQRFWRAAEGSSGSGRLFLVTASLAAVTMYCGMANCAAGAPERVCEALGFS